MRVGQFTFCHQSLTKRGQRFAPARSQALVSLPQGAKGTTAGLIGGATLELIERSFYYCSTGRRAWRAPPDRTAKRPRRRSARRRSTLIARHGYEAVSMRQLAAEVGVQAAALYRYFPTKEDLLFTLMREHMQELAAAWETARPATPTRPRGLPPSSPTTSASMSRAGIRRMSPTWSCAACRASGCGDPQAARRLREGTARDPARRRRARRLRDRRCRADRDGDHPDDHRRHRLVPAGRAAVGRRGHRNLSCHDDAPGRRGARQGGKRCTRTR